MKRLVLIAALALAGCGHRPVAQVIEVKVPVPVPVPCVSKDLPPRPTYSDTLATLQAAQDQGEFTRLLAGNWPVRNARLETLESPMAQPKLQMLAFNSPTWGRACTKRVFLEA
ncbi:MAG: hypothetical protein LW828_10635 [Xanthomonadaceae bacterium]|jgi:hypothetical protein|nr:hypothetical protein [Xanthomonadaceae bacterium]